MNIFRRISTRRGRKVGSHEIAPEDVFLDSKNLSNLDVDHMQGHLEQPLGKHGFYGVILVSSFVMMLFGYRLYAMQITSGDLYKEKADRNHLKSTPLFAMRGTIADKNGELLAWNSKATTTDNDIPDRHYVSDPGFSHLLGYVSYPKKDQSGIFWQDEYVGKDGVEKQYQTLLQGQVGERVIAINALHKVEAENITIAPIHGENLQLTIDKKVQSELYNSIERLAHKAPFVAGAGVIMDVHTGEILALTNYPEYDNNLLTNASSTEDNKRISEDLNDPRKKFLNRVVSGLFTPGSTVKPYIALAALMEDIIDPYTNIYSSGQLVIKNKYGGPDTIFRDWKKHGYVDMRHAIAVSSDEYFYQVGGGYQDQKGLGILKINKYASMFGFGTSTGIDLPGEKSGLVPSPLWKQKVFGEEWLLGNTYHTSIGQYGFQLTPLELVRSVAMIANGGDLLTPHVYNGATTSPVHVTLSPADLKVIREGMRLGVLEGTGKALNVSGTSAASKSGTAELGVTKDLVNSWITGYFPYENPKYAFVVIMEKGSRTNMFGAVGVMHDMLEWMRDNTDYFKNEKSESGTSTVE
jgi:penicillin-binding protein 2